MPLQGIGISSATFVMEILPQEYRDAQAWLVGVTWCAGVVLLAIISSLFRVSFNAI